MDGFIRTELLLGARGMEKLKNSRVAVFGVGGVGSYAVEALARSGIGALDLIDDDKVSLSNINRQLIALRSTVGEYKADAAAARIADINPDCKVKVFRTFVTQENIGGFDFAQYDYVIDAIDTVSAKLALIEKAAGAGVPIISSMGAGNKLDPTAFEVADIFSTSVCPLARVMRRELRKRGINRLKVVYSREEALTPLSVDSAEEETAHQKRQTPGSVAFVPSVAGLIIAGEVVKELTDIR